MEAVQRTEISLEWHGCRCVIPELKPQRVAAKGMRQRQPEVDLAWLVAVRTIPVTVTCRLTAWSRNTQRRHRLEDELIALAAKTVCNVRRNNMAHEALVYLHQRRKRLVVTSAPRRTLPDLTWHITTRSSL
eukprot:CAMPEP_0183339084 /NCGR_PEP_ID=MMETSP0164_2-20130417/6145_1 /TAXON_ID=221442 /ORGANISM="Coccolithus pelagicus ssp braarudi, Strain PLY182g" /LENGTH=130 /DNA_ID=CAMNT_0025509039 /DNA_START=352 /DNA_END=744 /DNA_ORIENTATION=+